MTRISKIYVVSSMLAALALSTNAAIAKGGNHGGGSGAGHAVTGATNISKQTATGTGAGKAKFNEFTIKKTTDSASPKLYKNAVKGTHYKKVTIVSRKAGGTSTGGSGSGTSYDKSGKGGSGNQPKESLEFNYGNVEYQYK